MGSQVKSFLRREGVIGFGYRKVTNDLDEDCFGGEGKSLIGFKREMEGED